MNGARRLSKSDVQPAFRRRVLKKSTGSGCDGAAGALIVIEVYPEAPKEFLFVVYMIL